MTLRLAHETFCDFINGKFLYDDELTESMRFYMDEVDDLIKENITLSVELIKTQKKLCKERKLKEKYYKKLKRGEQT